MVQLISASRTPLEVALMSRSHVLISGPTGAGKSRLAREIHNASVAAGGPFVSVNLAALHDGTFESELFGHERGAFTGADRKKVGQIELAAGGTLFLDEIGELTLKQQARLLEFLQSGLILPLGARLPVKVVTRVIVATHRNLEHEVRQGRFREDLFYRLRVVSIALPSIAQSSQDFDRILHSCLEEVCADKEVKIERIAENVALELESYSWPGNFRELRHVLEFAVLSARTTEIQHADLPNWFLECKARSQDPNFTHEPETEDGFSANPSVVGSGSGAEIPLGFQDRMDAFEKRVIRFALTRSAGNISHAARILRMSKTTLLRRIKALRVQTAGAAQEGAPWT